MPKHERPLTPQTEQALDDILKAVADEMDVSVEYLRQIMGGYRSDPYAHFRPLFKATARVDIARAAIWRDDINRVFEAVKGGRRQEAPGYPEVVNSIVEVLKGGADGRDEDALLRDMQTARGMLDSYITAVEARRSFEGESGHKRPRAVEVERMARSAG